LKVLETKSERIDLELKADPTRSDREIGRICGVSHHTVGRRRAELGLVGNLVGENAQPGSLFAQEYCPPLQDCPPGPENCPEDSPAGKTVAENSATDETDPKRRAPISAANADDPNPHVLAGQQEIEIYLNEDGGLVLKQANWPDEDSFIIVAAPYKGIFLDKVCDVLGVM